jgi:hypothetical protein
VNFVIMLVLRSLRLGSLTQFRIVGHTGPVSANPIAAVRGRP